MHRRISTRAHIIRKSALFCILVLATVFGLSSPGLTGSSESDQPAAGRTGVNATSEAQPEQAFREAIQEYKAKQKQLNELKKELRAISVQAMQDNPELRKKRESLRDYKWGVLEESLNSTSVDTERMREIEDRFISGNANMTRTEAQKLSTEYRQMEQKQAYQNARREMLQDEEVQKRTRAFNDEMFQAMKEQNPEVESLNKEWMSLQKSLQRLRRQLMQMRMQQQKGMQQQSGQ